MVEDTTGFKIVCTRSDETDFRDGIVVSGKCLGLFGLSPKIFKGLGRAPLFLKPLFVGIKVVGGNLAISCGEVGDELVESEVGVSIVGVFKDLVLC